MKRMNGVKRKCVAVMAGAAIVSSGLLGSCSEVTEETTESSIAETTEETTSETTEETTEVVVPDPSDIEIPNYDDTSFSDYYYPDFASTNGELEGQDEFMRLRLFWGQERHYFYDDLDEIEDPDTRALAQSYADQGYLIYSEEGISTFGDIQYEFCNGFGAQYMDGETYIAVSVARMNETLFNYFVREGAGWNEGEGERTDDGTIVRYNLANEASGYSRTFEFSRETGFLVFTEVLPDRESWPVNPADIDYNDDFLEAYALACIDDGYFIHPNPNLETYYYIGDCQYNVTEGFMYWDGSYEVEYVSMSEDLFIYITDPSYCLVGGRYDSSDDGNILSVNYYDDNDELFSIYEYDRTTGLAHIVYFFDC